jgi:hypothetical protein
MLLPCSGRGKSPCKVLRKTLGLKRTRAARHVSLQFVPLAAWELASQQPAASSREFP